jgi:chemotaxis-related protein WspD
VLRDGEGCWGRVGVWGDRSCPELATAVHCHNCPVFTAAGSRFLEGRPPDGYLDDWTANLAEPEEPPATGLQSALVFRLGGEWLALPVGVLREVVPLRPVHRIPFHGGALAGLVNVRGELHLSARLDHLLGMSTGAGEGADSGKALPRLLVVGHGGEAWVFRVDEVDRVRRFPAKELAPAPPTLGRAAGRFTRGVFRRNDRAIGLLDEGRLFEVLRTSVR